MAFWHLFRSGLGFGSSPISASWGTGFSVLGSVMMVLTDVIWAHDRFKFADISYRPALSLGLLFLLHSWITAGFMCFACPSFKLTASHGLHVCYTLKSMFAPMCLWMIITQFEEHFLCSIRCLFIRLSRNSKTSALRYLRV